MFLNLRGLKILKSNQKQVLRFRINLFFLLVIVVHPNISISASDNTNGAEKIRGGYMGTLDISILPEMSQNGMNTALVKFRHFRTPVSAKQRNELLKWSKACEASNQDLLAVVSLWLDESKWFKPDHYLVANGKEYRNTPCPRDSRNYKILVHDRFIALAQLSKEMPISGAVLDTEMYNADFLSYKYTCNCDYCWSEFKKVHPELPVVEKGFRENHLQKKRLVDKYKKHAIAQISSMASQTRKTIDQINPMFQIGGFCLDELDDYTKGLCLGFGTPKKPVLVFSEKTYKAGCTSYIEKTISGLKKRGINAKFETGIWQNKFPTENLAEQYYHSARNSDGYWIYTMQSLNRGWKKPIAYPREKYWMAIKTANNELDKLLVNSNHKSNLKLRPFSAPLDPVNLSLIKTEPLIYVHKLEDQEKGTPPKIRRNSRLVFIAKKGDVIRFTIDFNKHRNSKVDHAVAYLLDNKGNVLSKEIIKRGKTVIQSHAGYSGSYSLYVNNDKSNAIQITGMTHFYSIEAVKWDNVHLKRSKGPIYFYGLPGAKIGKIAFFVNGPSEGIIATFNDDSGRLIGKYDIDSKMTVEIPLPKNRDGSIITMNIEACQGATYRSVIVTVKSGLGKYISPFKTGLVREISY